MIQWEVVEQPGDDEIPARLVLTVQPGEPIRVRSRQVSIEGPASRDSDFVGTLPEKPSEGDVLNHGQYSTLRQTIQNRGHPAGVF